MAKQNKLNPHEQTGVIAPGGMLFGHPRGLFLVASTEFWERFSYYGMLGLLVLYLTSKQIDGGFGWTEQDAISLYALYSGAAFIAPTIGGWLCGAYLGERRCILWGGIAVAVGHIFLGGPGFFPWMVSNALSVDINTLLNESGVVLGKLFPSKQILSDIRNTGADGGLPDNGAMLVFCYLLMSWSFGIGLLSIIIGTGFIKSSVSSIVSRFYPGNDKQREAGFAWFMASIYLGSLSANFIVGTLGEKLGWHYGFSVSAVGMCLGILVYYLWQDRYLADIGRLPDRLSQKIDKINTPLSSREKKRCLALIIMGVFTVLYAAAFYQKGGLLNIFTKNSINRLLFGFEIPATWFLSISTGLFVVLAPLSARLWSYLEQRELRLSADQKQAFGLIAIAIGYGIIVTGVNSIPNDAEQKISMVWIVLTYIAFAVGDVLIWPAQIATVGALAPERFKSLAIGAWYLTIGFGTWLTGVIGAYAYTYSLSSVLFALCIACFSAGFILIIIHKPLVYLMR